MAINQSINFEPELSSYKDIGLTGNIVITRSETTKQSKKHQFTPSCVTTLLNSLLFQRKDIKHGNFCSPFTSHMSPAFTLAEVLITLGIIGVVAAMTLPTMLRNINDAELKNAFKKKYAELAAATTQIANENGGEIPNSLHHEEVRDEFCTYLTCQKKCDLSLNVGECWHAPNSTKGLRGDAGGSNGCSSGRGAILPDGTLLQFGLSASGPSKGGIDIDVNGFKPPNTWGRDIYNVGVYANSLYTPRWDPYCNSKSASSPLASNGMYCAVRVLQNENY